MTENAAGWPDVAGVLDALTAGVGRVFGGDLVGLYLTGSLSYGGFDHGSSDIDFLAVLTGPMTAAQRTEVAAMHADIAAAWPEWATRIEGSYLPQPLLACAGPPAQGRPYVNGGVLWQPDPAYGQEWVMNLFVLHRCGVTLAGRPVTDVIPPISMAAMRAASTRSLHEEWEPLLDDPAAPADPHHQAYITLTLCRILHTAHNDGVASKRDAAAWVADTYGEPWRSLADRMVRWQHGEELHQQAAIKDFIRFVRDHL